MVGELRFHTVCGVFKKVKWNETELWRGHFCRVSRGGRGWGDLCLLFLCSLVSVCVTKQVLVDPGGEEEGGRV